MSRLENAERFVKIVKEIASGVLLLAILLVVILKGVPVYKKLSVFLDRARISKVAIAGVELSEQEVAKVKEVLDARLPRPGTAPSGKDVVPSSDQTVLAGIAKKIEEAQPSSKPGPKSESDCDSTWVYLGTGRETFRMFRNKQVPQQGEVLVANTSIFERDAKPVEVAKDKWKLGRVVGVLKDGQSATVRQLEKVLAGVSGELCNGQVVAGWDHEFTPGFDL